jgi:hypothetical protein
VPCGALVAMKRRAVELVKRVKILPEYHKYIYMCLDVLLIMFHESEMVENL